MAENQPLLGGKMDAPTSHPISPRPNGGRKFPQAIAHRGYKAAFPENTMGAFKGAVDIGAHAIETDVHLSKDGVVVISHDATLKRCFGEKDKIIDCDWSYLETLRTLQAPKQPMPRLTDLLEYLSEPGLEHIWILLDIKLDDDPDDMMRLIAKTLKDSNHTKPWKQRIVLGLWAASYLPLCAKYLPGYQITHIGVSIPYAREFLKIPKVSFNLLYAVIAGPGGDRFFRDLKAAKRSVYLWTINDVHLMKWSIDRGVDGVVTDDPKTYLEVCNNYTGKKTQLRWKSWGQIMILSSLAKVLSLLFRIKHGFTINKETISAIIEANQEVIK